MIGALARKLFGSPNDRRVKGYQSRVGAINALEPEMKALSDDALKARTEAFRKELASGKTLDDILVPAFATVREAAWRVLEQRHFDVQLIGGMVLHEGDIAEMKTGEGKTLVATLAVYLNALAGRGVHVVTVNDYLARRDAEWMGRIYKFLGLSVGVIVHGLDDVQRRASYACDVTYGTNNEFGFDYLRDNMKMSLQEMVQFGFRLFPGVLYQEISQARADLNDQAMRTIGSGNLMDIGAQAERAAMMSSKALSLAVEVLDDLKRREIDAPEATRQQWTARREHLDRLFEAIKAQMDLLREGMEGRDADKVRSVITQLFRLSASLAVELQAGAQRHATETNAAALGSEALDIAAAALADLDKRSAADGERSLQQVVALKSASSKLKQAVQQLADPGAPEARRDAVDTVAQLAQSVTSQVRSAGDQDSKLGERVTELSERAAALIGGKGAISVSATQGGHYFAIVDEVDSILIDEARTPLIISGPLDDRSDFYNTIDTFMPKLEKKTDYEVDEKQRQVTLTEGGMEKIEVLLRDAGQLKGDSLYDVENVSVVHHINQALRAHSLFTRDKDYIVRDDEVVIIDEFTGRMMPGRRYSEGLHQALEAKEHVTVQPENQTLASITFQNYFRMYEKLAGMTGTAATEADELFDIYKLEVVEIPTNLPVERRDEDDEVYRTQNEKYAAILAEIERANKRLQPVLVGTASIEKSELLAEYLKKNGYKQIDFSSESGMEKLYAAARAGKPAKLFAVLNARFHEQEAYIVAEAGVPGAITIATNMAGRGTDIKLGGSLEMRIKQEAESITDEAEKAAKIERIKADIEHFRTIVLKAEEDFEVEPAKGSKPAKTEKKPGGLYIIGSERHESRRIDNQLRGRSGRQGDPGRSKFFLSLEDDLMRIFGSDRLDSMLQRLGLKEGEAIIHPWINKALEKAQQKVEARNFDIRKNLLKFDNVQNDQRKVIFDQRVDLMKDDSVAETVADMRHAYVDDVVAKHVPEHAYAEQWDVAGLKDELSRVLGIDLPVDEWAKEEGIADEEMLSRIEKRVDEHMDAKTAQWGAGVMRYVEKTILLQTLDRLWREHLIMLDHLRQVIGLRGYGQRDPLQEYKSEAFNLFETMIAHLREAVTSDLMRVQIAPQEQPPEPLPVMEGHKINPDTGEDEMAFAKASLVPANGGNGAERDPQNPLSWGKVGRNEECPCGSGKRYKHCHGKYA